METAAAGAIRVDNIAAATSWPTDAGPFHRSTESTFMIALVTIGQSPRPDVSSSMFNEPTRQRLLEAGALDGLSDAMIHALTPVDGDHPLVTRLGNGSEVVVA